MRLVLFCARYLKRKRFVWRKRHTQSLSIVGQLFDGISSHESSDLSSESNDMTNTLDVVPALKKNRFAAWCMRFVRSFRLLKMIYTYVWVIPIVVISFIIAYSIDTSMTISHVVVHAPQGKNILGVSQETSHPSSFSHNQTASNSAKQRVPLDIFGLEILHDTHMVLFDHEICITYLEERNIQLEHIHIEQEYPNTVHIYYQYRDPLAYVTGSGGWFVVDDEGRILDKHQETTLSLPLVEYYQEFNILSYQEGHHPFPEDLMVALHFVDVARQNGFNIQRVDIKASDMITLYTNEHSYIFTVDKDISTQEYQFLRVAKQYQIEGNYYKSIDVRFDKPLVVRW